jgi:hypothetical protein
MDLWKSLLELVLGLLTKKEAVVSIPIGEPKEQPKPEEAKPEEAKPATIDWTDGTQKVSKYFTVHDMIYLPTWKRMANEADGLNEEVKANLIELGKKMDTVREYFDKPINTHVTYRPLEYNKAIGGALHSAHSEGKAMDWDLMGMTCDEVRDILVKEKLLDTWAMRCEDKPASNWVHLDYRELKPDGHRFFIP